MVPEERKRKKKRVRRLHPSATLNIISKATACWGGGGGKRREKRVEFSYSTAAGGGGKGRGNKPPGGAGCSGAKKRKEKNRQAGRKSTLTRHPNRPFAVPKGEQKKGGGEGTNACPWRPWRFPFMLPMYRPQKKEVKEGRNKWPTRIMNAVAFSPRNSRVRISTKKKRGEKRREEKNLGCVHLIHLKRPAPAS